MSESKKGAGRPEIDNNQIIADLIAKPETREKLINQFKYLADQKRAINAKNDIYKDDVKATKESFGLAGGFITKTVDALVKRDVNKKVQEANSLSDLLSIFADPEEDEVMEDDFED